MIERPVSQEQCKELGGHYWNEYRQGADVNEFGEQKSPLLNISTADMSTLYDTIEREILVGVGMFIGAIYDDEEADEKIEEYHKAIKGQRRD